ncbi:MAG TPA: uL15 family ribosomal protein [bacterium]|nr:uL15 family ribosomal protein [bacterium]HPL95663.1 uL15 family ribosomal protein [bacterium]
MAFNLSNIKSAPGAKKKKKDIGRGGKRGTYSGRGLKGQRARSGGTGGLKRKGLRRLMEQTPKLRGFKSKNLKPAVLSLAKIIKLFPAGGQVSPEILLTKKIVKKINRGIKILNDQSEVKVPLEIINCTVSQSVKTKIEKAGGNIK